MKLNRFDVVELKNKNNATIIDIVNNKEYFAEIVNREGTTIDKRNITEDEIQNVIYRKNK